MTTLVELLMEAENAAKKGFKNGLWLPHKSIEGGNDTVAYGHKLDDKEQEGGFIRLADGTKHFLKDGGITEEQALSLLNSDIEEHRAIAETQWNDANKDTPFDSLSARDQDVLTELTFNIGTLKNKKGRFGWPELAKGIKDQDLDKIKKEVSRTFNGKKLNKRTAQVREFIDNPTPAIQPIQGVDIASEVRQAIQAQLAAQGGTSPTPVPQPTPTENVAQRAPESVSEGLTEDEAALLQLLEQEEREMQQESLTPEEAALLELLERDRIRKEKETIPLGVEQRGEAFREPASPVDQHELIARIF